MCNQPIENNKQLDDVRQSVAWGFLSFNSSDILEDNALELAQLLGVSLDDARERIAAVLAYYHEHRTDYPDGLDRTTAGLIVHLTQPWRIPHMTIRIDKVLAYGVQQGHKLLDYGGGGERFHHFQQGGLCGDLFRLVHQ